MNTSTNDTYNHQLQLIESNSTSHPGISSNSRQYNNIKLENGEEMIAQHVSAYKTRGIITDDITLIERTKVNSTTSTSDELEVTNNNSLNNRLEIQNNAITFRKDNKDSTETYRNSYDAHTITPEGITIKSPDGGILFSITNSGLTINLPTNIADLAKMYTNNINYTSSRNEQYSLANKNYIDQRVRTDYDTEYWRTVSTRLNNVDKYSQLLDTNGNILQSVISYPCKVKEYVQKDKVPERYEYEVIENCKATYLGFNDNNTGSKIQIDEVYKAPIFKTYKGSGYIIGTNANWSFSFSKAKQKTTKTRGIEEKLYDDNGNPVYDTNTDGSMIIETITI
jgi:hypothetical protein